jgi:hypothetical protein
VIDHGETVVGPGMEEFGSIRRLALDAKQDVESGSAGRRNGWPGILRLRFHCGQYDGSGRCGEEIRAALRAELLPG